MRGEIITIGDELVSGRVRDFNAHYLSSRLSSLGIVVTAISTVGDNQEGIIEVLDRAVKRSEFVLVCGGLGPTEDDITAEVAARFLDCPLVLDEDSLKYLKRSLNQHGLPWVDAYEKLAYVPEGARLIDPQAQACGFYSHLNEIPIFFLPGVPEEVRYLADAKVLPLLVSYDKNRAVVRQRTLKVFGLQEARIGELLEGLAGQDKGVLIGFYPNFPENHVTITVRRNTVGEAEKALLEVEKEAEARLEPYIVARDSASIEDSLGRLLREKGLRLAVAESCSGGLISHRITSVSGSSDYFERAVVVYSNDSKIELLNVPADMIKAHGAVSPETAASMAQGIRSVSRTDLGLATTGIAGPAGGTEDKPVGTVFIALADAKGVEVDSFRFSGTREQIKILTAQAALNRVLLYLQR
ncbi:MAG: competence/damage-inducible protein A [Deltaproteobacteria bacterium]|nr:competence/damage-inducible protein A [Deltaproteobacteria bacterium]MBW2085990.1 competence/damage-inducible protein A [Deltaproteobacteria bacterium]